jgi:hypothetical protein
MSYGLTGAFDTASTNNTSTEGEYHQYLSHYNPPSRSHQQSRPYSNGFHNSSTLNGHNRLDDTDIEQQQQQQQQQIDNDYEEMAPDRPRLLMWGLKKYKNKFLLYIFIYIDQFNF